MFSSHAYKENGQLLVPEPVYLAHHKRPGGGIPGFHGSMPVGITPGSRRASSGLIVSMPGPAGANIQIYKWHACPGSDKNGVWLFLGVSAFCGALCVGWSFLVQAV